MNKILIVEDDMLLAGVLKDFFEDNQLIVFHAADGEEAIRMFDAERPQIVLLDIVLPRKNGFEVINDVREIDLYVPIILMTGSEFNPDSEIKGYQLGAINYLKKPILPKVVLAVVENLLHASKGVESYNIGMYHITIQSQLIKIDNQMIQLRDRDIQVLSILLKKQGLVVPRQQILQMVWQDDGYNKNNALDSSISRIRKAFRPFTGIKLERIYAEGYVIRKNP